MPSEDKIKVSQDGDRGEEVERKSPVNTPSSRKSKFSIRTISNFVLNGNLPLILYWKSVDR